MEEFLSETRGERVNSKLNWHGHNTLKRQCLPLRVRCVNYIGKEYCFEDLSGNAGTIFYPKYLNSLSSLINTCSKFFESYNC